MLCRPREGDAGAPISGIRGPCYERHHAPQGRYAPHRGVTAKDFPSIPRREPGPFRWQVARCRLGLTMRHCPRCNTTYADDVVACPLDGATLSSAPRQDPLLHRVIKGRYRIVGKLGDGGMGSVYRAEQLSVGRTVALKVLHPEFARDEEFVQRFHQEARLAAALNHPCLTTVFDFDQSEDGNLFIVMEYLQGTLLSEVIRRESPLDIARVVRLGIQIAEGIGAAHGAGVIHRDIKPQNIRVLPGDSVKLMDFGIARLSDGREVHLTRAGTMLGTPQYMAPEQIDGRPVSEKTDIYAFGIVLYEMLSGQTPFSGPTSAVVLARQLNEPPRPVRAVRPAVPLLLEQVVMQALEKEPEFRQDRIADIVRRLRAMPGTIGTVPDETPAAPATIVAAPLDATVIAMHPDAEAQTMIATPQVAVAARVPDETMVAGTPSAAPAAKGPARVGLRWGRGTVIALSTVIALIVLAAAFVWWTPPLPFQPTTRVQPPNTERPRETSVGDAVLPSSGDAADEMASAIEEKILETVGAGTDGQTSSSGTVQSESSTRVPATKLPVKHSAPAPGARPGSGTVAAADRITSSTSSPSARPSPESPAPPPPLEPSMIKSLVEEKLRAAGLLRDGAKSGVEVETVGLDGVVRLKGVVPTAKDKKMVSTLAREVGGVSSVDTTGVNAQDSWTQQNTR